MSDIRAENEVNWGAAARERSLYHLMMVSGRSIAERRPDVASEVHELCRVLVVERPRRGVFSFGADLGDGDDRSLEVDGNEFVLYRRGDVAKLVERRPDVVDDRAANWQAAHTAWARLLGDDDIANLGSASIAPPIAVARPQTPWLAWGVGVVVCVVGLAVGAGAAAVAVAAMLLSCAAATPASRGIGAVAAAVAGVAVGSGLDVGAGPAWAILATAASWALAARVVAAFVGATRTSLPAVVAAVMVAVALIALGAPSVGWLWVAVVLLVAEAVGATLKVAGSVRGPLVACVAVAAAFGAIAGGADLWGIEPSTRVVVADWLDIGGGRSVWLVAATIVVLGFAVARFFSGVRSELGSWLLLPVAAIGVLAVGSTSALGWLLAGTVVASAAGLMCEAALGPLVTRSKAPARAADEPARSSTEVAVSLGPPRR